MGGSRRDRKLWVGREWQVTEYDDTRTDIQFVPTWLKVAIALDVVTET